MIPSRPEAVWWNASTKYKKSNDLCIKKCRQILDNKVTQKISSFVIDVFYTMDSLQDTTITILRYVRWYSIGYDINLLYKSLQFLTVYFCICAYILFVLMLGMGLSHIIRFGIGHLYIYIKEGFERVTWHLSELFLQLFYFSSILRFFNFTCN